MVMPRLEVFKSIKNCESFVAFELHRLSFLDVNSIFTYL